MEILNSVACTATPRYTIFLAVIAISGIILGFLLSKEKDETLSSIGVVIFLLGFLCVFGFIIAPKQIPTNKMCYTIEITDNATYKELIDSNYTFKKLYENKNIYEIIGEPLQEEL